MPADLGARRIVTASMLLGITIDAAVAPLVGSAFPVLRHDLRMSDASATWTTALFQVCYLLAVVFSVRAGNVLGKAAYLVGSFLAFAIACGICAAAPNAIVFAVGLVAAGGALGGIFANALVTFAGAAPASDRGIAFALFGFLALAAPTIAPLVAAIVVSALSWRVLFLGLGLAAAALGIGARRLMRDPTPKLRVPGDAIGTTLLVVAVAAFVLFVGRAARAGFLDPLALAELVAAVVAIVVFVARDARRTTHAILDTTMLRGVVGRGIGFCTLLGVLIASGEVQLQYARSAEHLGSTHAAAILALRVVGFVLGGVLSGLLASRAIAAARILALGFGVLAGAFVLQGGVTAYELGEIPLDAVMLVQGIGFALVMGTLGSLLFAAVAPAATASLVVFFKVGIGVGDAVATPGLAAVLGAENAAARPSATAYADVWAIAALLATLAAIFAFRLRARVPRAVATGTVVAFFALVGVHAAEAQELPPALPSSAPTSAAAPPAARPAYRPLRDEEDWRFACDPAERDDVFDGLKCMPIGTDPLRFVSVSAEAREWYERYVHEDWLPSNPSNGYLLERYLVGADLHLDRFHAYAQVESATAAGRLGGQGTIFRDDFAATDAYVAWRFGPLDAGTAPVALIVGRQELDYGAGRIVSARDGAGVRASFDGVRAVVQTPTWRVDALDVHPVAIEPFGFDDIPDPTQTLVGAYAARKLQPGSVLELYGFDDHRSTAVYARGVGAEQRYTVGSRVGRSFGRLATEAEATYQFGTFGRGAQRAIISASSFSGSLAYTFGGTRVVPTLAIGAGSGTGDTAPHSAVLRTYVPPAFRGSYLGLVQESGPANSVGFEPSAAVTYAGRTTLTVGDVILAEATSADAVYNLAGFPFRAAAPGSPTALGGGPLASVAQRLDRHFTVTVGYQRFNAGAHFAAAPPAAGISYDKLVLDYKI